MKIQKLDPSATIPTYAHADDSGLDLISIEDTKIFPNESKLVRTGIAVQLPPQTEAQIRPRSGLALKHQITVLNTPGTIDEGYRGEICVILINHGKTAFSVTKGMKIAQMVICPIIRVSVEEVESLSDTVRGDNGFGSTGEMYNKDSNIIAEQDIINNWLNESALISYLGYKYQGELEFYFGNNNKAKVSLLDEKIHRIRTYSGSDYNPQVYKYNGYKNTTCDTESVFFA